MRVISIVPWEHFEKKISWKMFFGVRDMTDQGCADCLAAHLGIGGGFSLSWGSQDQVTWFATGDFQASGHQKLSGLGEGPVRLGFGPSTGLRIRLGSRLVTLVSAEWNYFPIQNPSSVWRAQVGLRLGVFKQLALDAVGSLQPGDPRLALSTRVYF